MSETKPYFSIVIPLFNKESLIKKTLETVLIQTYQDFEIVIVNDGSKDNSVKIVESIKDSRIRIIHQKNQGVSIARNNGIKESKAPYIVFLDADDIWLSNFLETIHDMTINFPEAGMYATNYELVDNKNQHTPLDIQALPNKNYIGLIPNYFKSVTLGDLLVWTSAVCIPKKIFFENNIWFPEGQKFGEDQHVWARVAMLFEIAYNTKVCAKYMIEAENNTREKDSKEKDPQKSILNLREFACDIKEKEKEIYFNRYFQRYISIQVLSNMKNGNKLYAIKQLFKYNLYLKYKIKFLFLFFIPIAVYPFIKKFKNLIK